MPRKELSVLLIIGALCGSATLGGIGAARAGSSFDGHWFVVIRTVVGDCLPTMGYKLLVKGGEVLYRGGGAIRVGGQVDDAGRVNVGIRGPQRWAHALGRMNATTGSGTWRGTAPGQKCSGRWQAQRHR